MLIIAKLDEFELFFVCHGKSPKGIVLKSTPSLLYLSVAKYLTNINITPVLIGGHHEEYILKNPEIILEALKMFPELQYNNIKNS